MLTVIGFTPSSPDNARVEGGSSPAASNPQLSRGEMKSRLAQLRKIEKEIERLSSARESLEHELSDLSIYNPENRDSLKLRQATQAENSRQLEQAEEEWLLLSEIIEQQTN